MSGLPPPLPTSAEQLVQHHVARADGDLPTRKGITYVWAGNGLFKHAWNGNTRVLVRIAPAPTPGLATLEPFISWRGWHDPLPAALLGEALADALERYKPEAPEERQWFVALRGGAPTLITPEQRASHSWLEYDMPRDQVLCDIHSHHGMAPFFSSTDNRDDSWLGLSVVIGRLGSPWPSAMVRLNCYGHHSLVDLGSVFAGEARAGGLSLRDEHAVRDGDPAPWLGPALGVTGGVDLKEEVRDDNPSADPY